MLRKMPRLKLVKPPFPVKRRSEDGLNGSSHIKTADYHAATQTLRVTFRNGKVYDYYDVPPQLQNALIAAVSPGQYFHKHIRGTYKHRQTDGD